MNTLVRPNIFSQVRVFQQVAMRVLFRFALKYRSPASDDSSICAGKGVLIFSGGGASVVQAVTASVAAISIRFFNGLILISSDMLAADGNSVAEAVAKINGVQLSSAVFGKIKRQH